MSEINEEPLQSEGVDQNFKGICVEQKDGGKFYYPKTIPIERSLLARNIYVIISIALFVLDILTNENKATSVMALYDIGILINLGLQILHRIILAAEEINHLVSRYDGKCKILLKEAFYFTTEVWITAVIAIIYAVYYFCNNSFFGDSQFSFYRTVFFLVPVVYFMGLIVELDKSHLNDSLWVAKDHGLDYGSGMAYSFFYGYLNLVLPKSGTEDKNLKELMQDYEDENHIRFAAYKLFILIPKSLKCFVSLSNEHSPSVEESKSLPPKIITIAGVQNRPYKNAVYKITSEKSKAKIYVSAEYATPLKTFKDVFNATGEHSAYYERHKNDIILQFYLTLKKVLAKTKLEEFCELIYYEDEVDSIHYFDVGQIILKRLRKLKRNQRTKSE